MADHFHTDRGDIKVISVHIRKQLKGFSAADDRRVMTGVDGFACQLLVEQLLQTVNKVRRQINPKLKIEGILLTMVDTRTNDAREISELIRNAYGGKIKVYDTEIPRSVRASEISKEGKSIFKHDPGGKVAEAYRELTREVVKNAEKRRKRNLEQLR